MKNKLNVKGSKIRVCKSGFRLLKRVLLAGTVFITLT